MRIFKWKTSLLMKMILLISIVVMMCITLASVLISVILERIIDTHFGKQAMVVAKLAAEDKRIIQGFDEEHPPTVIQPIAENIRMLSGASYVVIGNTEGIRYSHHDPNEIGRIMGTSNNPVIHHQESVIYKGTGVSGAATKAKTPIYNDQGELIGVSSVGFLYEHIKEQVLTYQWEAVKFFSIPLCLGFLGAFIVARSVKKMIFGLEPEEISYLFKEKEAILESIHDATIAIDMEGRIVSINKKAREILLADKAQMANLLNHPQLHEITAEVLKTNIEQKNRKLLLNNQVYVIDSSPIQIGESLKGVVFTFRLVSEIEQFAAEFSKIKTFSENMRAHNHEFLNKLNVIYGLLKLNQKEKAMELISNEVKDRQDAIAFLVGSVKEPLIAACLLGKVNRAKELKVSLEIDKYSKLQGISETVDSVSVVTVLSNIIDNAIEAAQEKSGEKAKVRISFTDIGSDILFDIDDNGSGIVEEKVNTIFEDGYTTKNKANRGLGLAIVKSTLDLLHGQVFISKSDLGGARFTVSIPK